ncbi:MAG TPA: cation transporter [Prolixibacteraceae bacterium]|nr:cation transporter [Prolixibacteraceae bacterium]
MKIKVLSLVALFMFGVVAVFAANKVEKIKVYGNCGMCKARIEKAAKAVDGVTSASWNKETKIMDLAFDDSKTDVHKIKMAVAKVGHDTDMHKSSDEAYNKLPGCCKYDRTKTDMKMDDKKDMKMDMSPMK